MQICNLCFICIPAFHESPSGLCWGSGSAKTLNKYDGHCCLLLVQVFLVLRKGAGMRRRWARVCGPGGSGGEAGHTVSLTPPGSPPHPIPEPFNEIRQRRGGNSRAFPLGFQPEVIFHSLNCLLWSPSGQNCEMSTETLWAVYLKTAGLYIS